MPSNGRCIVWFKNGHKRITILAYVALQQHLSIVDIQPCSNMNIVQKSQLFDVIQSQPRGQSRKWNIANDQGAIAGSLVVCFVFIQALNKLVLLLCYASQSILSKFIKRKDK